jgi:hypothetical protein
MMTYQTRLFLAFAVGLLAFALACFVGLLVTSSFQKPAQFPDIIATQPNLK